MGCPFVVEQGAVRASLLTILVYPLEKRVSARPPMPKATRARGLLTQSKRPVSAYTLCSEGWGLARTWTWVAGQGGSGPFAVLESPPHPRDPPLGRTGADVGVVSMSCLRLIKSYRAVPPGRRKRASR